MPCRPRRDDDSVQKQRPLTVAVVSLVLAVGCSSNGPGPTTVGIVEGDAPEMRSWSGSTDCCGEDPHPVHGAVRVDGSLILVGKSIDGGQTTGFVTRWQPPENDPVGRFVDEGSEVIVRTRLLDGDSALLQVVDAGEVVVVVGFVAAGASADARGLALALDPDSLEILARLEVSAPDSGRSAALESAALHSNGRLVLGGSWNVQRQDLEGFKSYGNVVGGQGLAIDLDLAAWLAVGDATVVTPIDLGATTREVPEVFSLKSMRITSDGGVVTVGSGPDEVSGMVQIDPGLQGHRWTAYDESVELTDVQTLTRPGQPDTFALVGHGGPDSIDGQVRLVDGDGATLWTLALGNPSVDASEVPEDGLAPDAFVFDECWGAAQRGDELVIACGTGIEGCDEVQATASERSRCRTDPRRHWRSYLVGVDAAGDVLWSRADSMVDTEGEAHESAAEFVVADDAGDLHVIVDHAFGVGLLRLGG